MSEHAHYLHCSLCIREKPPNQTPSEFSLVEVSISPEGVLTVQCKRHNVLVARFQLLEAPKLDCHLCKAEALKQSDGTHVGHA